MVVNPKYLLYFMHISFFIHSVFFKSLFSKNEEKLVALLAYTSFIQVANGSFWIIPLLPVVEVE